jgi:hypothetical protein
LEGKGECWVGRTFQKYFPGHGYFQGEVVKLEDELYSVKYEDGDEEELEEYELKALLLKHVPVCVKQEKPLQSDERSLPSALSPLATGKLDGPRTQKQPAAKHKDKSAAGTSARSAPTSKSKEKAKERKPGESKPGWKEMGYHDLDRLVAAPGETHVPRCFFS